LQARGENLAEATNPNPRATARTHPTHAAAILHNAGFAASEPGPAVRAGRSLASEQWRSHCVKQRIV
jgi:hypothetical protein